MGRVIVVPGPVVGRSFVVVLAAGSCWLALAVGSAIAGGPEAEPRVITDGQLKPGHLETMRVEGFPGKGVLEISFFPTAICEAECGARSFRGARTNASGAAKFRVRIPGTFFDHRNKPVYFRDGERIDVNVTWEGPGHSFAVGSAEPEPILVRTHGSHHG
ncbi:MAG: hypothetical protein ACOYD4_08555 [Solirubrobacterales bacterium]